VSQTAQQVRIVTNYSKSSYYHTDDNCRYLHRADQDFEADTRVVDRASLEGHYTECPNCAADDDEDITDNGTSADWDAKACPRCGEEFYMLGKHLPACDGGGSA
jgi:ribosomal protein S27AE